MTHCLMLPSREDEGSEQRVWQSPVPQHTHVCGQCGAGPQGLPAVTVPTLCSLLSPAEGAQHPVSHPGQAQPPLGGARDESHRVKSAQTEAHGHHDSSSAISVSQQFLP